MDPWRKPAFLQGVQLDLKAIQEKKKEFCLLEGRGINCVETVFKGCTFKDHFSMKVSKALSKLYIELL